MRLAGWNHIPDGYGARFDVQAAPWWLRVLYSTPIVDRFAHPLLVERGHGYLLALSAAQHLGTVSGGWRIDPPGYAPPGARVWLTSDE